MQVQTTPLEGLLVIRPAVFADARGHFLETWNAQRFADATGVHDAFVQDNESMSHRHVLRGLHFQMAPHAQGKLVRVIAGAVLDVVVDIRAASPTRGQHFKLRLDDKERTMLWIPPGFAHGFLALEDRTVFSYKCTAYYSPSAERTIRWNDKDLGIDWGIDTPLVSEKDQQGLSYADFSASLAH
ncbi:MAG: dTDP-4-dehydrorhamnose 3,5-epimerase [Flavobacteriales bacterium]|nr:dTDP-4-dehydrorhamnose 3,5-epimerase [Flavobacteriales bacterium]